MRADCLLDLTLANKAELVRDVKAGGSLGWSNHEIVDFRIMREGKKRKKNPGSQPWHSGELTLGCSETY